MHRLHKARHKKVTSDAVPDYLLRMIPCNTYKLLH
jgi:hypothetical protein